MAENRADLREPALKIFSEEKSGCRVRITEPNDSSSAGPKEMRTPIIPIV